jgi:hypothetical protein
MRRGSLCSPAKAGLSMQSYKLRATVGMKYQKRNARHPELQSKTPISKPTKTYPRVTLSPLFPATVSRHCLPTLSPIDASHHFNHSNHPNSRKPVPPAFFFLSTTGPTGVLSHSFLHGYPGRPHGNSLVLLSPLYDMSLHFPLRFRNLQNFVSEVMHPHAQCVSQLSHIVKKLRRRSG